MYAYWPSFMNIFNILGMFLVKHSFGFRLYFDTCLSDSCLHPVVLPTTACSRGEKKHTTSTNSRIETSSDYGI